jgi:HAE1 family hydrophobic/amphiphilic exporter-1
LLSKFFIERPVLANVIAILTIVIGAVAMLVLPVAQYPNVVPPTVQVTTRYPGASARTVIDTVALPIEQQVNGVEDMIYMQSYASDDGSYSLTVTFKIGVDLNFAQVLVQNRVQAALASLPQAVQAQGVVVQKKSTAILQFVTLSAPDGRFDSLYLANYATINLKDELSRLPGVGNVNVFGAGLYAMRIWARSGKDESARVDGPGHSQLPATAEYGSRFGSNWCAADAKQRTIPIHLKCFRPPRRSGRIANIIVKTGSNGEITRVRDIGHVELGAKTYGQVFSLDRKQAAGIAIFQSPGANALDVATAVKKRMTELSQTFPQGLVYGIPFDITVFVKASIDEVYKTLLEAAVLVLIVILVFLQDWRAMLVPMTTVPVTIIGAFAAMAALGFTVNFATLFALVLAIGIVVDDAIIVVEGAAHNIDQGMSGPQAAIEAMRVLLGPIIGITLVLLAVFLPAAFLPGLTGQMYAQFALVIAATALISAVNALTLKPTQCALWLRTSMPMQQRNAFYRGFNALYSKLEYAYTMLMRRLVGFSGIVAIVAIALIAVTLFAFSTIPRGFIPIEDQGYMLATVQLPDGSSLGRTQQVLDRVSELAEQNPGVDKVITIAGISALDNNAPLSNAGIAYIMLKDWGVRGKALGLLPMLTGLNSAMSTIEQAIVRVLPPPPIQGIGFAAGFTMQVEMQDNSLDFTKLGSIVNTMLMNAGSQSTLQLVLSPFRATAPQYAINVDRVKAESLGLTVNQVFNAFGGYLGSSYVNQFTKFGRTFQVFVQADAEFRLRLNDVLDLTVRNSSGSMIPLGTLIEITPVSGPSLISLYNLYPSASIVGIPARGTSSGQSIALMEQVAAKTLPPHVGYEWSAMSYQEKLLGNQMFLIFAMSLLLVYLVLAGQYESWYRPLAVIFAVPISLIGPVSILSALHIDNNLYTQIGIVLLIALSAKNAILIVEFAHERRAEGKQIAEAAVEAARARFRPILMTSFAFILGVVPLVLATGAGANARASIGITVFTGMLASTCLAILFVPSFFVIVQRFEEWLTARKQRRAAHVAAE